MIISDLEILEFISEEDARIEGGLAIAEANANANASGQNFAGTRSSTFTSAYSNQPYYWYGPNNSASSGSSSSSAAD